MKNKIKILTFCCLILVASNTLAEPKSDQVEDCSGSTQLNVGGATTTKSTGGILGKTKDFIGSLGSLSLGGDVSYTKKDGLQGGVKGVCGASSKAADGVELK